MDGRVAALTGMHCKSTTEVARTEASNFLLNLYVINANLRLSLDQMGVCGGKELS